MKSILLRLLLPFMPAFSIAQEATIVPQITKGTVITYDIKDNGKAYRLIVKVNTFSEKEAIQLQWSTNEIRRRSGTTVISFGSLTISDQLSIKLVSGKELLDESVTRFFIGENMYDDLDADNLTEFKIDGVSHEFVSLSAAGQTADIMYNGSKVAVAILYGEDTDAENSTISIINLDYEIYLLKEFTSKKMVVTLKSIITPPETQK
jgi:hypothetical protein